MLRQVILQKKTSTEYSIVLEEDWKHDNKTFFSDCRFVESRGVFLLPYGMQVFQEFILCTKHHIFGHWWDSNVLILRLLTLRDI